MSSNAKPKNKKRKKKNSSIGPSVTSTPARQATTSCGEYTAQPALSESQLRDVMAKCQPFILGMVPKALRAFDQALSSDNPRLRITAAVKLFEGIGLLGSRGTDNFRETARALEERENEKSLMTVGLIAATFMEKDELYNLPVPEDLAWATPKIKELQKLILDRRKSTGPLGMRNPGEIPPLAHPPRRDPPNPGVRGYGQVIEIEDTEPNSESRTPAAGRGDQAK